MSFDSCRPPLMFEDLPISLTPFVLGFMPTPDTRVGHLCFSTHNKQYKNHMFATACDALTILYPNEARQYHATHLTNTSGPIFLVHIRLPWPLKDGSCKMIATQCRTLSIPTRHEINESITSHTLFVKCVLCFAHHMFSDDVRIQRRARFTS
jgi:hypothetical protein